MARFSLVSQPGLLTTVRETVRAVYDCWRALWLGQGVAVVHAGDGACAKCRCSVYCRGHTRRRSQQRCQLMIVALHGWGGLRGRPSGQDDVVKTGFESG